ncbi:cytidine deaminase-like protein [Xylona heveae TC161]|uniref:Cytidine deaminase-like protein n=1 Tax=Xylona heveae (strain CBS 132557 / TC161) TaxID=1328760 RepID=A0A165FAB1_XYLHT|nr:cytidine deaminase-like protein [Xylona heveae TC161]KZF20760.1 cytidine deaminase-like protein [Xylona heveae TC161]
MSSVPNARNCGTATAATDVLTQEMSIDGFGSSTARHDSQSVDNSHNTPAALSEHGMKRRDHDTEGQEAPCPRRHEPAKGTRQPSAFEVQDLRSGTLIPLKTTLETQPDDSTVDVYIVELPAKQANGFMNVLKTAIPERPPIDLQHLRRIAKQEHLPDHLKRSAPSTAASSVTPSPAAQTPFAPPSAVSTTTSSPAPDSPATPNPQIPLPATLQLLVGLTSQISLHDLTALLSKHLCDSLPPTNLQIQTIQVPRLAPTNEEQARQWSSQYWPTIFRRNNPFGPQPNAVQRAEDEILPHMPKWMALACQAAAEVHSSNSGEAIGAVIVESNAEDGPTAVAVAGDARWCGPGQPHSRSSINDDSDNSGRSGKSCGAGNVMTHAVMRAIGLVAAKRRTLAREQEAPTASTLDPSSSAARRLQSSETAHASDNFFDKPLNALERAYFEQDNLSSSGYLCLDLDIYLTHEPCIMCCMAILHSRFGRVVFGKKMLKTGGMAAEKADMQHLFATPSTDSSAATAPRSATTTIPANPSVETHEDAYRSPAAAANQQEVIAAGGLGYGLFWRRELNWKMLGWQWLEDGARYEDAVSLEDVHA